MSLEDYLYITTSDFLTIESCADDVVDIDENCDDFEYLENSGS